MKAQTSRYQARQLFEVNGMKPKKRTLRNPEILPTLNELRSQKQAIANQDSEVLFASDR